MEPSTVDCADRQSRQGAYKTISPDASSRDTSKVAASRTATSVRAAPENCRSSDRLRRADSQSSESRECGSESAPRSDHLYLSDNVAVVFMTSNPQMPGALPKL